MTAQDGFSRSFWRLAGRFWLGRAARGRRLLLAGLGLMLVAQVVLMVRLNIWNADLFDALERHSSDGFLRQVAVFLALALGMMLANASHLQLKRWLQLEWRGWLTRHVIDNWLREGRHYALALLPGENSNADGRIAEDIRIATESAIELASSLLYAVMLLACFLSILWGLSGVLPVPTPFGTIAVPGHMVALALAYSAGGSAVAFVLGRPLVQATDERQGREANFRFALAHARGNAEALALARAEPQQRASLSGLFAELGLIWHQQTRSLRSLLLFSVGYGQFAPVLPLLVTTPRYLIGSITLGGLMQTAQAFQQVAAALSWPVDNAQRLAEWRASAERVLGLQAAVAGLHLPERNLVGEPLAEPGLALQALVLQDPDDSDATQALTELFLPGEGILLTGDPHGAALLCKAVAGHWRWGQGSVRLPPGQEVAILVAQPWLADARLADILAGAGGADPEAMAQALHDVGLGSLVDKLEMREAWEASLSDAERQRLQFARLLVRRPGVILLDNATSALAPDTEWTLLAGLRQALPQAIILLAGRVPPAQLGYRRVLELRRPDGAPLPPPPPAREGVAAWLRRGFGYRI